MVGVLTNGDTRNDVTADTNGTTNGHSNGAVSASRMDKYARSLPGMHLEPLWTRMSAMVPPSPNPIAVPHLWSYDACRPYLLQAGSLVSPEEAERRVLMLVNPAMHAPHTTDTLYAGLQLVMPGEVAPAHRHVAFAIRFIISGEGGYTAVEGRKMPLTPGDVVVTPTWHWHDHGNEGSEPVVWLDVLNLPLFTYARVNFAENYHDSRYPSEHDDNAAWCHSWETALRALDRDGRDHAVFHYRDGHGRPLSTTIGAQAERIGPGKRSAAGRAVASFVYHCRSGRGRSVVTPPGSGAGEVVFEWREGDTFAVPAWSSVQHVNGSDEASAYLVGFHDGPMVDCLGLRACIAEGA